MKRKQLFSKNTLRNSIVFFIIIIIALLCEVVFNHYYLMMPKQFRGLTTIGADQIESESLTYTGDKFTTTEGSLWFSINASIDICNLEIKASENSKDFRVYIYDSSESKEIALTEDKNLGSTNKKEYWVNSRVKEISSINVNENSGSVYFVIDTSNSDFNDKAIEITEIAVNNHFEFNFSRFFLIVSILTLVSFFFIYKKIFIKNLSITFVFLTVIFGLNIVFLSPTFFSSDEKEHFVKAYQVASFDFGFKKENKLEWPENIEKFNFANGKTSPFESSDEKVNYYNSYFENDYSNLQDIDTTAATYLPTAYIFSALGIGIAKILKLPFIYLFYSGRLFSMLFYIFIFTMIINKIKIGKRLVFILGLLPGELYLAASYSADPLTYAFSIATIAAFVNMLFSKNNEVKLKQILFFLLFCSITIMGKMTYAPLILLIFAVPKEKFYLDRKNGSQKKYAFLVKFGLCFCAGMVVVLNLIYSSKMGLTQWPVPGVSTKGQILFILSNFFEYIKICLNFVNGSVFSYFQGPIGNFASSGSFVDSIVLAMMSLLVYFALVDNDNNEFCLSKNTKIWLLLVIICSWGLTITALYITYNPVGSRVIAGVQGRYFAPLLLPFLLLLRTKSIHVDFLESQINFASILMCSILNILLCIKLFVLFSI